VNPATERARELVATLAGAGVRHVVLCPGSRSSPLAYALFDLSRTSSIELHVRHDERVAGFTALGLSRGLRAPAAVVTTSGTAVANLHPAVLEAHHSGVPLLVLAADRPPRLRGTWANQTSDLQVGMFGAATRLTVDLVPGDPVDAWGAAARDAVAAALGTGDRRRGPVLLNLAFDEPLLPDDLSPWRPGADDSRLWTAAVDSPYAAPTTGSAEALVEPTLTRRTVVIAGDGAGPDARRFAEAWGLPLLAEPTSGSRGGPNLVAAYRLLLDLPALGGRVERVVAFGRPTLSRPVTRLLARPEVAVDLVQRHPDDPGPERADVRRFGLAQLMLALAAAYDRAPADAAWLGEWRAASSVAAQAVHRVLDGWPVLTGPLVAREVAAATGGFRECLVLAASNPVRDVDLAGGGWPEGTDVFANRGLSGIDGTVSTAIGMVLGGYQGGRVLVGDVALLHDIGSLVLGPDEARPDLTVVVVNDSGGGIFSLLEPGLDAERDPESAARFERVFGTPHAVDLAAVCSGVGVPHVRVASAAGLRERLSATPKGLQVIEVRVDRDDLRPLHDAIGRAVREAVQPTGSVGD
jgi:2-succinyl-5-enolpyruvyl-6-hydroxy-3-cyclohexene-1-carboxylate synthase